MDLRQSHPGIHVSLVMPGIVATGFHQNAIGGEIPRPPGAVPMPMQTAEEVAEVIVRVIDNPAPETYTNPATPPIMRKYFEDVAAFERDLAR
jgi:short-subunit dehydrogenase